MCKILESLNLKSSSYQTWFVKLGGDGQNHEGTIGRRYFRLLCMRLKSWKDSTSSVFWKKFLYLRLTSKIMDDKSISDRRKLWKKLAPNLTCNKYKLILGGLKLLKRFHFATSKSLPSSTIKIVCKTNGFAKLKVPKSQPNLHNKRWNHLDDEFYRNLHPQKNCFGCWRTFKREMMIWTWNEGVT